MYLQHLVWHKERLSMDKINSNELLNQLQVLARKVQETNTQSTSDNEVAESSQFSELMKDSINKVNDQQMKAGEMTKAFEMNDPDVPLSSLMIEMQKARVSFEALKQVRNQLVDAYKQVMNMPL
jgi:flagellar hook-basal body complex protein FliE